MPAKSAKQYNYFQAVAHGPKKEGGPSKKVAKEMLSLTPDSMRNKYSRDKKKKKGNPHY